MHVVNTGICGLNEHAEESLLPATPTHFPGSHATQPVSVVLARWTPYLPTGQSIHSPKDSLPEESIYRPAGQPMQSSAQPDL